MTGGGGEGRTIAALFVAKNGCYFGLPDVDPWDEARDARKYGGPWPVVAHPPCQRWGALGIANYARWGGDHNRPGNDGGCFASALASVRKWGGVLEHPALTRAYVAHGIARPIGKGWTLLGGLYDGMASYVCEVWQSAYGHRATKRTWLYYVGLREPAGLRWDRPVGECQIGYQDKRGKERNKPTLGKEESSATPLPFRDALLALARSATPPAASPRREGR